MFSKFLHTLPKSQLDWIFLAIYLLFFFTHVMFDLKVFADTVVSSILTKKTKKSFIGWRKSKREFYIIIYIDTVIVYF